MLIRQLRRLFESIDDSVEAVDFLLQHFLATVVLNPAQCLKKVVERARVLGGGLFVHVFETLAELVIGVQWRIAGADEVDDQRVQPLDCLLGDDRCGGWGQGMHMGRDVVGMRDGRIVRRLVVNLLWRRGRES